MLQNNESFLEKDLITNRKIIVCLLDLLQHITVLIKICCPYALS